MLIPVSASSASCQAEDLININVDGETSDCSHGNGPNNEEIQDISCS